MADHTADHVAGGPPPVDRSGEGGEFRAADSGGRAHDGFRYRVPLTPAARPVDGGFSSRGSPIVPVDSPSPAEEKRTDPDDPDNLAGWVGSLAEVKEGEMIAGRRTGPVPTVPPGLRSRLPGCPRTTRRSTSLRGATCGSRCRPRPARS